MQIFPVGLSEAPWPGPASNVAGPHEWDATPFPPQASADLGCLEGNFPAKRSATKTLRSFLRYLIKRKQGAGAGP